MRSRARILPLALALSAVGCGDPAIHGGLPSLSFAQSTVVFPDTVIDRVVAEGLKSITLTNVGDESLTPAFALMGEADFAIESSECGALAPGASCDVVVRFEPHALGARSVDLAATVAGSTATATLVGVALPEPGLSSNPTASLNYALVAVGGANTLRLTVRNGSAVTARPYTVALAGVDVEDFTLAADSCSGISVAPSAICTIDVLFAPSVTSPRSAQLVVSSANLGTLTIALDGNGYVPAHLAVSPDTGMFGSAFASGVSVAKSYTVTNSGTVPSPTLQVTVTGTNASYFALTDGCSGAALAAGASCMFSIGYHPGTVGTHQAAATVSAGTLTPLVVPLTGTGEPGELLITPYGWNFPGVLLGGTTDSKTLVVENTGSTSTGPLTASFMYAGTVLAFVDDGCTGVDLAPGGTCSVEVNATPIVRGFGVGWLVATATRGDRTISPLQFQGIVAATLTAAPAAAAFGDVQMTESPHQEITVQNTGDLDTGTIAVTVVGADSADVSLVEDCTGSSLPWFGSCSLAVSFSPSHLGAEAAAIEITSPGATLTIPVTANTLPAPMFTVSPDTLTLNPVVVGASYPLTFVVQGTGGTTGPLTVAVTGSQAAEYTVAVDDCSGQTLGSGQACTVTLTLTPTGTGSRNAVLVVAGEPGGHRRISLTAIAFTQATLTISRSTVMFAATGVGQTDTYGYVSIKNTGQLPTGTLTAQLVGADPTEFGVIADSCTGAVLAPNAECWVHTQFAPTKIASSTASLVVAAAPGGTVSAMLSGTGLAPPVISSPLASYAFPPQETFTIRGTQIRIDNVGGSPTDHLDASLSGPQAELFTADDYHCYSVAAGAWCDVYVEFHPTDVGQASATLTVQSALAGSVTIMLTGTATPGTKITVSPDTYDFGFIAAGGTSALQSFIATNIGQRDVTMFQAFVPSGCDNFEVVSTTCGSTLAPNASCQADVVFHPVSWSYGFCRLVFVEDTLVKGEAQVLGQSTL